MKIAFLTPEYPHPMIKNGGGIGTSIFSLSHALSQLGHHISILVYAQDKDENFVEGNIHIYKIKNIKVKGLSLILTQRRVASLINTLYKSGKIEIVEAPDWTGFTSFIKPLCPLVLRLHGSDTYFCHLDNRKVKFRNKFLEKRALKKANGVIAVSKYVGDLTNELFGLKKDFTVIPNGIDVSFFTKNQSSGNNRRILYFGTLIRKKGLFELPSIFNLVNKKNKNIELVLVGKDSNDVKTGASSTWQLVEPLFDKESIEKVKYLGKVEYSKIQGLIADAAVCVFPTFAEALPVSWLEAMAMEKAIVASDIGWAKEMIEDGKEGFLVHPTNHEEYADRILELIGDKDKREKLGKAARVKVEQKFNHTIVAKRSAEFYDKLLEF